MVKEIAQVNHFDQKIQSILEQYKVVGCQAVAVYKNDVVWSGSYGFRNLETGDEVTEHTMFRIASITKLFTATAIMKLVENHQANLDEDISKYLGFKVSNPLFPEKSITLKHLLTHTSSLTSDEQSNSIYAKFIKDGMNNFSIRIEELLTPGGSYYTKEIWGNWEPGDSSKWVYSNIGAIICGAIIEKVTKKRFDLFIREILFKPLGMKHVAFSYAGMQKQHELANLYEFDREIGQYRVTIQDSKQSDLAYRNWSSYIPGTHGALFEPQGGLRTTAIELSKFLRAHMFNGIFQTNRILEEHISMTMKTIHWSRNEKNHFFTKMGLGFHISHDFLEHHEEMVGHAGEAYGLISNLYWNEQKQFGIIFILNGAQFDLQINGRFEVERELAEVIYYEKIEPFIS